MALRLPPLNALKAFEATSRLLSATKASEELHVTQAAVSHHIKLLESQLGVQLFKRLNRKLLLTEIGQRYSRDLQEIFKLLSTATEKVTKNSHNLLMLSVEPAFANYWLIPRIDKFNKKYPALELRISASYNIVDFKKSDVDIGIRWGNGKYAGLQSTLLFKNEVYPVCSPSLLKKHPIKKPNDLKHHTLLHETAAIAHADYPDWRDWVKLAKAKEVNPESGLYFETGYLLIQAAIEGQGIALERSDFVEPAIKAKKLIRLFDLSLHEPTNGYYIVFPENRMNDTKIASFLRWIKSELKK